VNFRHFAVRIGISIGVIGLLFLGGCSKKNVTVDQPEAIPTMPMMMKEDPRSIKSVEGVIQEVDADHLVVHTKKNVSLKFKRDGQTEVSPSGKKLAVGMSVKIEIDHISVGMRAKSVQVENDKS